MHIFLVLEVEIHKFANINIIKNVRVLIVVVVTVFLLLLLLVVVVVEGC